MRRARRASARRIGRAVEIESHANARTSCSASRASAVHRNGSGATRFPISRTRRAKGSFRSSNSVVLWYFRISLNATVPGLYRLGFFIAACHRRARAGARSEDDAINERKGRSAEANARGVVGDANSGRAGGRAHLPRTTTAVRSFRRTPTRAWCAPFRRGVARPEAAALGDPAVEDSSLWAGGCPFPKFRLFCLCFFLSHAGAWKRLYVWLPERNEREAVLGCPRDPRA